ncbi:hypothetical protein GO491_10705 [Flavobacteriaceae bacterium Ap0902]|nr:hypothetical protein [Flavobacteriaceae bacterium Ap0902]
MTLLNACSLLIPSIGIANYEIVEPYPYPWLDMSKGTWAIYDIDAAYDVAADIDAAVYRDFGNLLGDRLIDAELDDELLIDKSINADALDKEALQDLAASSKIDYIILVKVNHGKEVYYNEFIPAYELDEDDDAYTRSINKIENFANIKIYDLNREALIFNRSCKARLKIENKQPIDFSPSERKMMKKTYKKLFRSLKAETKT